MQGGEINESHVMPPTAGALKDDYPEMQEATRLRQRRQTDRTLLNNKIYNDEKLAFVDSNFFRVLRCLSSRAHLKKLYWIQTRWSFRKPQLLNISAIPMCWEKPSHLKTRRATYRVTGVMKDIPANSHFHFDMLGAMAPPSTKLGSTSWMTSEFFPHLSACYPDGYDYKELEAKLLRTVEEMRQPAIKTCDGCHTDRVPEKRQRPGPSPAAIDRHSPSFRFSVRHRCQWRHQLRIHFRSRGRDHAVDRVH